MVEYFSGRVGAALLPYHPDRGQEREKAEVEEGGGEKMPSPFIIFILLFGRNFGTWQQWMNISLVGLVLLCCLTIQTGGRRERRERLRREEERRNLLLSTQTSNFSANEYRAWKAHAGILARALIS